MTHGIDVSHYQGRVSWGKAHAAGVDFAFAKATQGTGFVDSEVARNLAGMRAAGVLPGAYHFLTAGRGAAQCDHFVRTVGDADGLLVALDVESNASYADVRAWVARWRELRPGHPVIVYTGRDLWKRTGGGDGATLGPLWTAGIAPNRYADGRSGLQRGWLAARGSLSSPAFAGWQQPLIVQWSESCVVPGVAGPCDADHTDLTVDELAQYARPSSTTGPGHAPGGTVTHPEADMPLTPAEIDAVAKACAVAVHRQQLFRVVDSDGTPLTIGDAVLRTYRAAQPAALAAAVVAALPAGTTGLTQADVEAALRRVLGSLDG